MSQKSDSFLVDLHEQFVNAHALVAAACRLLEDGDPGDLDVAVLTLRQGVQALSKVGLRIEGASGASSPPTEWEPESGAGTTILPFPVSGRPSPEKPAP